MHLIFILIMLFASRSVIADDVKSVDTGVKHVVLCWLKEPGNHTHKNKLIETSRELTIIPGILDLKVGEAVPSDRPIVDDSFDVGIVMSFADVASMQSYLSHEEHVRRVKAVFAPSCRKIQVYDIQY